LADADVFEHPTSQLASWCTMWSVMTLVNITA